MSTATPSTRERTVRFMRELNEMLTQAANTQGQIDQLRGRRELIEKTGMGDAKQGPAIAAQIEQLEKGFDAMMKVIEEKTRKSTLESAMELLDALAVRMDTAGQLSREVASRRAQYELAMKMGDVAEPQSAAADGTVTVDNRPTRADYERSIESAKQRYEAQIQLAWELVPSPRGILVLS